MQSGDGYERIAKRVKERRDDLFTGRASVYARFVQDLNEEYLTSGLQPEDCVALPVGWQDPNIGSLSTPAPSAENLTDAENENVLRTIAVIYGEQTDGSTDQQLYIWYSIRARIGSASRGPDLASVALGGEYHALGGEQYDAALKDLRRSGGPTLSGVIAARDVVLNNWTTSLPADAGRFYFHWLATSSAETCYQNSSETDPDQKERECAWQWAESQGWVSADSEHDWLKRIRGSGGERIGSMYIFP